MTTKLNSIFVIVSTNRNTRCHKKFISTTFSTSFYDVWRLIWGVTRHLARFILTANERNIHDSICVQESDVAVPLYANSTDVAGSFYTSASTPSGEVRCPLPSFNPDDPGNMKLYNWSVSVSNDNATWSDSVEVLVYDPLYVTCDVDGNGTYQCRCLPSENQVKLSSSQSISRSVTQSACIKILWRVVQC